MELDQKIEALFNKLDKITEKYNDIDKLTASQTAKMDNELAHIKLEISQIKEEQRIHDKELHVHTETNTEERYRVRGDLTKEIANTKDELQKLIDERSKSSERNANSYTNRGVAIAVGVITLIGVIVAVVYNVVEISRGH